MCWFLRLYLVELPAVSVDPITNTLQLVQFRQMIFPSEEDDRTALQAKFSKNQPKSKLSHNHNFSFHHVTVEQQP